MGIVGRFQKATLVVLPLWILMVVDGAEEKSDDLQVTVANSGLRGGRVSASRWPTVEQATKLSELRRKGEESPLSECSMDATFECQVHGSDGVTRDCDSFALPFLTVGPCEETPLTTTLLYNGGDCSQTDNADLLQIQCKDGWEETPPTEEGALSYIVVTDYLDQDIVYHDDWVEVGSTYVLDAGAEMSSGFSISIYDTKDQSTLLQTVVYTKPLCSDNLELLNRFGASQIVEFSNKSQGIVSPFKSFSYDVTLDITFHLSGADVAFMNGVTLLTNFAPFVNLSDEVGSQTIMPEMPITVTLPVPVDLSERRRNTMFLQANASRDGSPNSHCSMASFFSFYTGGRKEG